MYNPQMPTKALDAEQKQLLIGGSVGLIYGLLIRICSNFFPNSLVFGVMSVGFLLLVPFAMGFISVYLVERQSPQTISKWLFLPWVPVIGGTVATMLVYWEGMICAILFLPVGLLLGMIGGLIAGSSTSASGHPLGGENSVSERLHNGQHLDLDSCFTRDGLAQYRTG
jgi:hypothetical protein